MKRRAAARNPGSRSSRADPGLRGFAAPSGLRVDRKHRGDGIERGLGLGAVGPAGLSHIGPAAPALAAERFRAFAHQLDRVVALGQILGDADDDAGLALPGDADDGDDAGADLFLAFVDEALEVLDVDAVDRTREQLHVPDGANAVVRPAG